MECKIRNKRALGELLHKCSLWDEYKNAVLSSYYSVADFDVVLRQRVAEEICQLGSQCGDSAKHISHLAVLFFEQCPRLFDIFLQVRSLGRLFGYQIF